MTNTKLEEVTDIKLGKAININTRKVTNTKLGKISNTKWDGKNTNLDEFKYAIVLEARNTKPGGSYKYKIVGAIINQLGEATCIKLNT